MPADWTPVGTGEGGTMPAGLAGLQSATSAVHAVLPAKVRAPRPVPGTVARPQVASVLARCVEVPLSCVVAPAGFGKTSAVAGLCANLEGCAVAWYAASPEDADLPRFWVYVLAALRASDPALDACFADLADLAAPAGFAEAQPLLDALIVRLDAWGGQVVLVVEDAHTVQGDDGVAASLAYLVRNLPPSVHVLLTSRTELRLPLAKMRLAGSLVEVGEERLAFTCDQVGELLAGAGVQVLPDQRRVVWEKTGGWPAGVKTVALLAGGSCAGDCNRALALLGANVRGYLGEEVLRGLPDDLVSFLVRTSLVESFTPGLARILTGLSHVQTVATLDDVVARGLFVQRVEAGAGGQWFRYHPLFADLLHEKAAALDPDQVGAALRAACAWYRGEGFLDQAVELAARVGDCGAVREIVLDNWKRLYRSDSHSTLVRWARALPEGEAERSPYVAAVLATPFALAGDGDRARRLLASAEARLKGERDYLFALCAAQRAYLASFAGDALRMRACSEEALATLPPEEGFLRAMMGQVRASSWVDFEPTRAKELLLASAEGPDAAQGRNVSCSLWCNLAVVSAGLGRLAEARRFAARAYGQYPVEEQALRPMLRHADAACVQCAYEQGDRAGAAAAFERMREPMGVPALFDAQVRVVLAKCRASEDPRGAREAFVQAMASDAHGALKGLPTLDMVRAFAGEVREGRADAVDPAVACDDGLPWTTRLLGAAMAVVLESSIHRDLVCAFAATCAPAGLLVEQRACAFAAVLCAAHGLLEHALPFAERAALIAYEEGLAMGLVENAVWLRPALADAAERSRDPRVRSCLRELLVGLELPADPCAAAFSERELEVARLIARGMSLAQAAEVLVVSRETVKKHLANVYAKLDVHSKTQAVAELRARGLIE